MDHPSLVLPYYFGKMYYVYNLFQTQIKIKRLDKKKLEIVHNCLKGTVTQNIFSLESGTKGCKDLGNDNYLQK